MVRLNDIDEYVECSDCKSYKSTKDIVKVKAKQSLIQMIKSQENYKLVCKDCIKERK